jgi:hypothetical protein
MICIICRTSALVMLLSRRRCSTASPVMPFVKSSCVYHLLPHQGAELTHELMCVASCMPWAANPYLIASHAAAAEYEHGKLGAGYGVLSYGAVHDDLTAPSTRRWRM